MLQITYLLDSFIELIPAVTKKSADHYVVFKKVRDTWLSLDNTEVKKANMSGMFRVNLAFYRNINTSKCVDYNIDFVDIKQGHARKRPPLLVNSHPKYSGQDAKRKKSSTQPQLSIPDDPSKEFVGEGPSLQNEVSAGGTGDILPETSDTTCSNVNASVPLTNVDTLPTIDETVGTKSSEVKNNSENDKSQSNTHNEASHANPSEKEDSTFHDKPQAKGGCSAADMPPLEFKKRLVVNIEKYPNLLKRFQEGKVKVYVSRTEDERLNTIKEKVISKVAFKHYFSETVHETENPHKPILSNTAADPDSSDDESSGSSVKGDDSETDPDYNPTKDIDDEDTPSEAKKPKTTNKGNSTHLCYRILLKYSELLPSISLLILEDFTSSGFFLFVCI